jgi:hypothetical protein
MLPPTAREFRDIYVVFELLETDLHQVRARAPAPRSLRAPRGGGA